MGPFQLYDFKASDTFSLEPSNLMASEAAPGNTSAGLMNTLVLSLPVMLLRENVALNQMSMGQASTTFLTAGFKMEP